MSKRVPIVVPQMNPNDEHAILVKWHVTSGTHVTRGTVLATMETSKAAFDIEAPDEGFAFFDQEPNAVLAVGSNLAWLADSTTLSSSRVTRCSVVRGLRARHCVT